jgi:hypothetical protein
VNQAGQHGASSPRKREVPTEGEGFGYRSAEPASETPFLRPEDLRRPRIPKAPKVPSFGRYKVPGPDAPDSHANSEVRRSRPPVRSNPFEEAGPREVAAAMPQVALQGAAGQVAMRSAHAIVVQQVAFQQEEHFSHPELHAPNNWFQKATPGQLAGLGTVAGVLACSILLWVMGAQ